jgi:ribosomal subunit interface protein
MKVKITARHFKAKDSLQIFIKERLESLKHGDDILHIEVVLSYDKPPNEIKYCELIVKLKDKIITTKEGAEEFTKSVESAATKIETQLYKRKDK